MTAPHVNTNPDRIAVFVATSGHSGVDRYIGHLVPAIAGRGYTVDVIKICNHGPHFDSVPYGVNIFELKAKHVYSSFPALVGYLRLQRPAALLSDKDRLNRTSLAARLVSKVSTRVCVATGTAVSIDLAHRGLFERIQQKMSMRHLYPYAHKVILTSQGVADDIAAYVGNARDRLEVVPCPVVPQSLFQAKLPSPDHPFFRAGQPPVILGVGELASRKDFSTLMRGFVKLHSRRPCRLVILGRGKQHDRLRSIAAEAGIAEDVDLPGFVARPYEFMAHAGLLAMTSRWEGLGFVLIETLALGTPVVSTDCPSGPREILKDGIYGKLVPVGDADRLAQAMADTLDQPLPPEVLKEAARPFEIETSVSAYLKAMGLNPRGPKPHRSDPIVH